MKTLFIERLDPRATLPTVAHPGEDLGFDIYALDDQIISPGVPVKLRTGIAAYYADRSWWRSLAGRLVRRWGAPEFGLEVGDRSGLAANHGLYTLAGKIDAGYRGEILVIMVLSAKIPQPYYVKAGDKIAQLLPRQVLTCGVREMPHLPGSLRGSKGFGSTGR